MPLSQEQMSEAIQQLTADPETRKHLRAHLDLLDTPAAKSLTPEEMNKMTPRELMMHGMKQSTPTKQAPVAS
jgi:hypothetical protein